MPYDMEMMNKRKGAMKPSGSMEVEIAFKKAAAKKNEAAKPDQDIASAIAFIKEIEMSHEDRETLLALLGEETAGAEKMGESEVEPAQES